MQDYYKVLDIRNDATISEIKLAYKKSIHKYHPDISKESNSAEKFKVAIKAYKTLSDPIKRMDYDKKVLIGRRENKVIKKEKKIKVVTSKKTKFVFSSVFSKNKLTEFFNNIQKVRSDLRRKKFVDRETIKMNTNINIDYYKKLSKIELTARLKASSNQYVRATTAKIMGTSKDKSYFLDLVRALSDSSKLVRKEVIESLGKLKDYRAVNFLANAVYDYDKEVRYEVAKVLRNFQDTRAVSALLTLMKDKEEEVVAEAILSLGVIGDKDMISEIRKMFKHPSLKVKRAALEVVKILR